jgi:hypothetical protein
MDRLQVGTLQTNLHLQPSRAADAQRLTHVLQDVLDESLETALERLGVPCDEEICIRDIYVPVSLRLSASNAKLCAQWSLALASHIEQAVRRCGPDVVRYLSPWHALIDLALGVARGTFGRAWACRQMGLIETSSGATPSRISDQLVAALEREPAAILPVLLAVARHGALPSLIARLPAAAWPRLAIGALAAGGVTSMRWEKVERACAEPKQCTDSFERARIVRCLESSALARAARNASSERSESASICSVLAVLALLDCDRGLLLRSAERVADLLAGAVAELQASAGTSPNAAGVLSSDPKPSPDDSGNQVEREGRPEGGRSRSHVGDSCEQVPWPGGIVDAGIVVETTRPRQVWDTSRSLPAVVALEPSLPDINRQRGFSHAGGLLLLLGILDDTDLAREIVESELGSRRTQAWALHQLALALAGVDERDAAALAFAGLSPQTDPPSIGEEPPTQTEVEQLLTWRRCLEQELITRVPGREHILAWVCRREAEIVADPGWIEVHLSLDEVSTEIRRAGLDLDPGYLPWLGLVIKYVYRERL